ncbi:MAG: EAL domain-containing protein [Lachnospiraceae bacterium]|nr:EAL domain-containing protein [Lachnospiraceae bacterium]
MNIQMQVCGLLIMLLLLYFCIRQKSLWMTTERMFLRTLIISMICVSFDILSIAAIVNREHISAFVLAFICKSYLVSLVAVGYSGLVYTNMDLSNGKMAHTLMLVSRVVGIGAVALIYILPIDYYNEGRRVYTLGASVQATYVFALICVLATMYRVLRYGNRMNPKRAHAIRSWMCLWILATVIQACNNSVLLVGFATSLGMVILFFELENPEANMDRETGAFNSHALREFMKQKYQNGEPFSLLLISLEKYQSDEFEMRRIEGIFPDIIRYFETVPDAKLFKRVEHELVLMFRTPYQLQKAFAQIQERFREKWEEKERGYSLVIDPVYVILQDSSLVNSAEEIFRILGAGKEEREDDSVIYIDKELLVRMKEKENIARIIRNAIRDDRVEVFYQPIYSVAKKQFVSAEALVRIRNQDGSILPPGVFIPVAEENGSILRLGEIVFEKTCEFIKKNDIRKLGIEYIEVNLSVEQCENENLADSYIRVMEKYQVDPSLINLEITETGSIKARKILLRNMETLIAVGVKFSLDDFGNGESNLNYIVDMPVQIVKFDRDMTQAYFAKEKAKFVMHAAKNMIQEMGLEIVAEGVETEAQLQSLAEISIDFIQGFYFSKPLPQEEFLRFIEERRQSKTY